MLGNYDRKIKRTQRNDVYRRDRPAGARNLPGLPVGVIAVKRKGAEEDEFNPLVLKWVVSPHRRDLNQVLKQTRPGTLGDYEQSLFDGCFKNWHKEDDAHDMDDADRLIDHSDLLAVTTP